MLIIVAERGREKEEEEEQEEDIVKDAWIRPKGLK